MYEYENNTNFQFIPKNPSNQSGGSITRVIVEEVFEDGKLVSKTTTTEYAAETPKQQTYVTWNSGSIDFKAEVEKALQSLDRKGMFKRTI